MCRTARIVTDTHRYTIGYRLPGVAPGGALAWDAVGTSWTVGIAATELTDALHEGRVKAVWVVATNPVVSLPDAERFAAGLAEAELVVCQDAYHPTETAAFADVVLNEPRAYEPEVLHASAFGDEGAQRRGGGYGEPAGLPTRETIAVQSTDEAFDISSVPTGKNYMSVAESAPIGTECHGGRAVVVPTWASVCPVSSAIWRTAGSWHGAPSSSGGPPLLTPPPLPASG